MRRRPWPGFAVRCWPSRSLLTVVTGVDYVLRAMRLRATASTVASDSEAA